MIAGFVLSAYLQLALLSGYAHVPNNESSLKDVLPLPPQAVTLQVQAERKIGPFMLNLHGLSDTYLMVESLDNAKPFSLTWSIGASLSYGIIELGYNRACYHPMDTYIMSHYMDTYKLLSSSTEGYSRELYIRFNIK